MVQLPAYAPELNPAEDVWANMKSGLGNLAACTVDQLAAAVRNQAPAHPITAWADRRFLAQTGLSLETEPP